MMTDRDCANCIWKTQDGDCTSWECDGITRREARKRLQWQTKPPKDVGFYLVTKVQKTGQKQIAIGHWSGTEWSGSGNFSNVTHWLELPEVPE